MKGHWPDDPLKEKREDDHWIDQWKSIFMIGLAILIAWGICINLNVSPTISALIICGACWLVNIFTDSTKIRSLFAKFLRYTVNTVTAIIVFWIVLSFTTQLDLEKKRKAIPPPKPIELTLDDKGEMLRLMAACKASYERFPAKSYESYPRTYCQFPSFNDVLGLLDNAELPKVRLLWKLLGLGDSYIPTPNIPTEMFEPEWLDGEITDQQQKIFEETVKALASAWHDYERYQTKAYVLKKLLQETGYRGDFRRHSDFTSTSTLDAVVLRQFTLAEWEFIDYIDSSGILAATEKEINALAAGRKVNTHALSDCMHPEYFALKSVPVSYHADAEALPLIKKVKNRVTSIKAEQEALRSKQKGASKPRGMRTIEWTPEAWDRDELLTRESYRLQKAAELLENLLDPNANAEGRSYMTASEAREEISILLFAKTGGLLAAEIKQYRPFEDSKLTEKTRPLVRELRDLVSKAGWKATLPERFYEEPH